ncbi:MAG: AAA family ATPase [Peptococcaceae bacterium]|nr:AAA family ATPase [Peptococcaceae bacterium]
MKIDRLQLDGFGKFSEKILELGPGFNVIFGENESGKSTLQNFLRGMLFGLKKPGARRSYDELLQRYRPWQGSTYGGAIEYSLGDRRFRVERNFAPEDEKVRVLDGDTWQDITAEFPMDKRKEVLFAQTQLGISQIIFDNTVCVRQLRSENSEGLAAEINAKLVNLGSSGEEDISIHTATQILDAKLREIGLTERSAHTTLGKVTARVEALEQSRLDIIRVYEEVRAAETAQRKCQLELESMEESHKQLRLAIIAAEAMEIRTKLSKIDEYDSKIAELRHTLDVGASLRSFPLAQKDNLLVALEKVKVTRQKLYEVENRAEEMTQRVAAQEHRASLCDAYAVFDQESAQSAEAGFTRMEALDQARYELEHKRLTLWHKQSELEADCSFFAGCAGLGIQGEVEFNQLEADISEQKLKAIPLESDRLRNQEKNLAHKVKLYSILAWLSLGLGLGLGAMLGQLVAWSLGLLAIPGCALFVFLWLTVRENKRKLLELRQKIAENARLLSQIKADIAQKGELLNTMLKQVGAENSKELHEKMRQWVIWDHNRQNVANDMADTEKNLTELQERSHAEADALAVNFFVPVGIDASEREITRADLVHFVSGLNNYLQVKAELEVLVARQQELERERDLANSAAKTAQRSVENILTKAGVESPSEFMADWEQAQRVADAQKSWQALNLTRKEMIGETSSEELEARLQRCNFELEAANWHPSQPLSDKLELTRQLEGIADSIQMIKESIANLQGIMETKLAGVSNLAEVEVLLLAAWQEKERVLQRRKALELARQTIVEVSHQVQRDFAPLVNKHMAQTMQTITAGRYTISKIDHEMTIKVEVPEVGEVKDLANLSLGTVDQFYFALRLALVDLMGIQFPLLLDEPFSQYDDTRLAAVLRILLLLAQQRQIVVFTCHTREMEMLQQFASGSYTLVKLSA